MAPITIVINLRTNSKFFVHKRKKKGESIKEVDFGSLQAMKIITTQKSLPYLLGLSVLIIIPKVLAIVIPPWAFNMPCVNANILAILELIPPLMML